MSLALQRSRRQNAGSKMAKLIDNEEEDEFYKTAYGGFNEVFYFSFITNK
jgi:vacuolar protein sorting-associated protein 72